MNEKIESLIKKKNALYRTQRKSINFDYTNLNAMTLEVSNAINIQKQPTEDVQTSGTPADLCQHLFFNKVAGLRPATLLKKRHWGRCFSVNFANFLQNTSGGCF